MNKRVVLYSMGRIILVASPLMLFPAMISLVYRDGCFFFFLIPAALMALCGLALLFCKPADKTSYAREGFVTVGAMWILFSLFGALPFWLSRCIPSFVDAFFETVSGFTTTGSTILRDVEALPPSMLFWRSLTHWVGGMGVLALAIAVMPGDSGADTSDRTALHLLRAETPGPTFGKLVAKLRYNVRILYAMYAVMTALEIVFLLIGKMPLFDSVLTAFGTAGTGGFGVKNSSIAFYDSAYLDTVIAVFMLLFGVNFNIYYFLLTGNLLKVLKSEELRCYLAIIAASTALITVSILPQYGGFSSALRYSFFQVSSIITTTGFVTADFELWPVFARIILVILMFIGACASSTGGGLKIARLIILVKTSVREIRKQINPREVRVIRCDGVPVSQSVVSGVSSYFVLYILLLLFSTLLISVDGKDPATTATAVIACLNNIGPGLGEVGATGNFAGFSIFSKLVLSFDMLAGRLELYPLLVALSPSIWKKNI
ncbi:MAG: TrkH family potassium uptake protein [Eubacteriales bacterium]